MRVQVYADGADLAGIERLAEDDRIAGFTTNPSLMRKAGAKDYRAFAKSVLELVRARPVSFEVFADDFKGMERQALEIAAWGDNVYVKVPVTNSKGEFTGPVITKLSTSGVKLNITAVMTSAQVAMVVPCLEKPGSIVSIFAGRVADTGVDPEPIMRDAVERSNGTSRILWASAREVFNVVQAERCGCSIITLSPELISKWDGFGRDLTAYSIDTVRQFKKDAEGLTL